MSEDRLGALTHYVIWKCDPASLGKTKLNKILWFADVLQYRRTGRTITGATTYTKLQHGPVPKGMLGALAALKRDGKVSESTENYYGRPKAMFLSLVRPDLSEFDAEEIATVDMVADVVCHDHTAASISRLTHDALWDESDLGADMSIGAASVVPGEATAEDIAWAVGVFSDSDHKTP
jgi:Antitoxin SocA-like, Panacea domain